MKKLLTLSLIVMSQFALGAFDENSTRYMMPADFYSKILMLFPNGMNYCTRSYERLDVFGAINPVTGIATSSTPDANFVSAYFACAASVISEDLNFVYQYTGKIPEERDLSSGQSLGKDAVQRVFAKLFKALGKSPENGSIIVQTSLSALPPAVLLEHTTFLIHYMLGPDEVIKEFGQLSGADELAQKYIKTLGSPTLSVFDFTKKVLSMLTIRDEFLMY